MKIESVFIIVMMLFCPLSATAQEMVKKDVISTSAGDLEIAFIGHGSLQMTFGGKNIHIDPYSKVGDYTKLPKADLVLLTHDHPDHLDQAALQSIRIPDTMVLLPPVGADRVPGGTIMNNGDVRTVLAIKVEAIPAYNIVHKRDSGELFHPPGVGNGYVLTFGDKRVYVAGDTENVPEIKALRNIDCAFLPMNLPYTMTPEMVADAARAFKPKILYPYHYGETDPKRLSELLKDTPEIEVRIRPLR